LKRKVLNIELTDNKVDNRISDFLLMWHTNLGPSTPDQTASDVNPRALVPMKMTTTMGMTMRKLREYYPFT